MKIDIPKRALDFLSMESASNLKKKYNLIHNKMRHILQQKECNR